jgi:transposase
MTKPTITIPTDGVIVERTGKYRYAYKVLRTYRNERGQPTCDKKSIGRITDDNRLIPNGNFYDFYSDIAVPHTVTMPEDGTSHVKAIGASFLVSQVLNDLGVSDILRNVFGEKRAFSILSIAEYMVCRGNIIEYIDDWTEEYSLGDCMTPQKASLLFSSITYEDKMRFFRNWVQRVLTGGFIAYDVTSFSCYGKSIEDAEFGYNRDGDKLPQINMGCYFSYESGLPVFYVTYPGSIVDKSHLQYIMQYNDELQIKDVIFIMDRGFCSTSNLQWFHKNKYNYILAVEKFHNAGRLAIDEVRDGLVVLLNRVQDGIYAKSIHSRFYGVASNMHIFYNNELAEKQRTILFKEVEDKGNILHQLSQITSHEAKKYKKFYDIKIDDKGTFTYFINYDKVNNEAINAGYFCILSNLNYKSSEILNIYRRKDSIEKGFDDIKNFIDMKKMRTHTDLTTNGKLFCSFIALIASSQISEKLRLFNEAGGHRRISKHKLICELEKIKVIIHGSTRRLMNPPTKLQRELLVSLGIAEAKLQSFASGSVS